MSSKLKEIMEIIEVPIKDGDKVLYLGASHGVTAELISDIVGKKGFVFCLDIAHEVMATLLEICRKRENMCPLLFDAMGPEEYKDKVTEVDVIYQDLAQKDQASILKKNAKMFLKKKGHFILIVKTQSIDTVKDPSEVLDEVMENIKLPVDNIVNLNRTHAKHYALIGRNQ